MVFLAATAVATPVWADGAAADACASKLGAEAGAIYAAARPGVAAGGDLKATITDATKALVKAGKIARADARSNAQAAGACLKLI
ncbi:hypothetical protein [Oharaeibacter diazotrophicus]|uniref:Uncharacterized protein n=1 Tax=Oharaeibacter diazotrophicus TaxID=1920512 RepID=A0A4R6R9E1_9HYPH|nr:hypothetical protein [Oharaeibacter diazotrophicus]TDP82681.1 hypothetical protein EDD54_3951 [Oharaeibacter diazotrophicus]BBE72557.1 hypothetical protein OHA_1_02153 [Pleomorphomonas sp. SM30]